MRLFALNAGWMLLEKIFRVGAVFLITAWIARTLGPEAFGKLNLYITIAASAWIVAGMGMDVILLRDFSRGSGDQSTLLSTAYVIRASILIIISIALIIYAAFFWPEGQSDEFRFGFIVVAMSIPFYNVNTYFPYYQATSSSRFVTFLSVGALALSSLIKLAILLNDGGFIWMSVAVVSDVIVLSIAFAFIRAAGCPRLMLSLFDPALAKSLLSQSAPLAIAAVLIVIYTRVDQFILEKMTHGNELGLYSVGVRVSEAFVFLPTLVSTSFFPMISNDLSRNNVRRYLDVVSGFSAVGVGVLCLLLPMAVPFLFGEQYAGSVSLSCVLLLGSFFAVSGGATTNYFVAKGMPYVRLIRSCVGIVLGVGLNLIWIPRYGAIGAAYAALVSQIAAGWLCNALTKSTRECFVIQTKSILTLGLVGLIAVCSDMLRSSRKRRDRIL
ncbi:TPA: flippase [Stenotrophomonas maltophilia]|nr:flippase [Stenotrophomonas maltophilia]